MDKTLQLVVSNRKEWEILKRHLETTKSVKEKELRNTVETHYLYRLQGYITALQDIIDIEEKLRAKQN